MLRRVVCAAFVLAVCVGFTLGGEFMGRITKIEGGKVTFTEFKGKEKGDTKTLPLSDKVKVVKGKFNKETMKMEAGEPVEGGLKSEMFTKIGEKVIFATIVTDKDNKEVTEIRTVDFSGFKKKKDKDKE